MLDNVCTGACSLFYNIVTVLHTRPGIGTQVYTIKAKQNDGNFLVLQFYFQIVHFASSKRIFCTKGQLVNI